MATPFDYVKHISFSKDLDVIHEPTFEKDYVPFIVMGGLQVEA